MSSRPNVTIRRSRPQDKAAVIALLRDCYDGWHGAESDAYWGWRHERNPHGRSNVWLAEDGGEVVGCYILSPVRLKIGSETVLGAQSVDAAVSKDYRRRAVFRDLAGTAMEQVAEDGVVLCFAFPTEGAFRGQLRIGYVSQFALPKAYRLLLGRKSSRRRESADYAVHHTSDFASDLEALAWPAEPPPGCCGVMRDSAYFAWRYLAHPVRRYETMVCRRAGRPVGYSVVSVAKKGPFMSRGYIVDLHVDHEDEVAAAELVAGSLDRMRSLGARAVACWLPPRGAVKVALLRSGFSERWDSARRRITRVNFVTPFIVCVNDPAVVRRAVDSPDGIPPDHWSLMPGDADYL